MGTATIGGRGARGGLVPALALAMAMAGAGLASAGCATSPSAGPHEPEPSAPARSVVAASVLEVEADLAAGDHAAAAAHLASAWARADALDDDRVLRAYLRELPAGAVPAVLARARAIEEAHAALDGGRAADARAILAGAASAPEETSRDALRLAVLRALSARGERDPAALGALARAANATPTSSLTRELASLARLTLASAALDAGDLKAAIADFLRVEPASAYWRAARFGLAMAQLRAGRPESALKILALLPGGLVAEPERAVVAAMAAHAVGLVDDATAIVDGALARRALWEPSGELARAVADELGRLARGGGQPSDETLVTLVAAAAPVRAADAELRATLSELAVASRDETAPLRRYAETLAEELDEVIVVEARAAAARARSAFDDLAALRPQLR